MREQESKHVTGNFQVEPRAPASLERICYVHNTCMVLNKLSSR